MIKPIENGTTMFFKNCYITFDHQNPKSDFIIHNYKNQNITKENFYLKLVSNFKDNNLNKFNFILPSIDYDPIEMKNQISLINKLVKNIN